MSLKKNKTKIKKLLLVNGPNLNLLGERNPEIYGGVTLAEIEKRLSAQAKRFGCSLTCFQSNSEGALIDFIQSMRKSAQGLIINPGAYSHTSIALRDALECFPGAIIEVHLSNIHAREEFRRHSLTSEVADGLICGLGAKGYELALQVLVS